MSGATGGPDDAAGGPEREPAPAGPEGRDARSPVARGAVDVTRRGALAFLVAAALPAVLLPGARLGLGLALCLLGLAAAAAVLTARRAHAGFALLGVALAAQAVLRDDATLVGLDALAAGWAAALALGGAQRWPGLLRAALAPWRHPLHGVSLGVVSLGCLVPERRSNVGPIARGAALAAVLVAIFGGLFASADGAFAAFANETLVPDLDAGNVLFRAALGFVGLALVGSLALVVEAPQPAPSGPPERRLARAEWVLPLGALVVLFSAFVAVQLTVLFGGRHHVLATAGLGYGEYARQGFGQLLVVTALTLAVVGGAVRYAELGGARDRWLLRALLGALCALTGVVLVSALHRLGLVEDAYGLTRVRLAGQALGLWLAALLALVVLAGVVPRIARALPRAAVALTLLALLAYSASVPDARIARASVERFASTGQLDQTALTGLGADAVPALSALPRAERRCVLTVQRERLRRADGWAGANRARRRARAALARTAADGVDGACRRLF